MLQSGRSCRRVAELATRAATASRADGAAALRALTLEQFPAFARSSRCRDVQFAALRLPVLAVTALAWGGRIPASLICPISSTELGAAHHPATLCPMHSSHARAFPNDS